MATTDPVPEWNAPPDRLTLELADLRRQINARFELAMAAHRDWQPRPCPSREEFP